ncbi:MAG: rhodanese-like domain-containing protein [Bacteroidota bacterium]
MSAEHAYGLLSQHKAILLDVREKDEYEVERVALPGVLHYPMPKVIENVQDIPDERLIIVMDSLGERGTKVANLLNMQGFRQVANLDGGLVQWKAGGFPVEDILPDACDGCWGCG